jgi:hypothetical protein
MNTVWHTFDNNQHDMKMNYKRNGEQIDESDLTPFEKSLIKKMQIVMVIWLLIAASALFAILAGVWFIVTELLKHFA